MKEGAFRSVLAEGFLSSPSILVQSKQNIILSVGEKKGMETKEIPTLHERLEEANRKTQEDMFKLERKSASVIHKLKDVTLTQKQSICFSLI